ncbi:ABC transporter C family member 3 [Melia azedarach]|uniref:ABC transporter C family member 3 n=1 Tax=Melia azedarach TaxID=155640 RepID=A0ACC1XHZ5_MELAZ|nr:ABC transporter C family member 3 [Melia azedarach]
MEISLEIVNVAFFMGFLIWLLVEFLKRRRDNGDIQMGYNRVVGEVELHYLQGNYRTRERKRWPLVLILWWVVSLIIDLLSVSIYLITHLRSIELPHLLPEPNPVDFVSLPLLMLLCFNALPISCARNANELEHPLLREEYKNYSKNASNFTNAGFWGKLTFRWLNPLFERGRTEKLELPHIPSIPQSETAEDASSLLEESIRKQKMDASSLPKVLLYAIRKSLAVNAVFAGINTIASYVGPLLITNFVNFLSEKHDDSSYYHGLVLASIFFIAKVVESLTQRQWYFGAHRIGIRVRSALTVLIYKKSLSIKFAGPSSGIIINMINVDVERIGDFCWYIHGIWLLPVQIFLALVILYRNLGAAPAFAAVFSTILVMVSNTPLANRQERFHSEIMKAKDSRIKATSETLKSMRVLKLLSWEKTFLKKLLQLREIEGVSLKKYLYTCSAVAFLFWASPTLVSVITFGVCILLKTPLTSGTVLSALATFRILQEPIYNLPELISMIAQTKVSIDRIQEFVREENQKKAITDRKSKASDVAIEIEVGEYAWNTSDQNLKKMTIKFTEKMKSEIPRISGAGIKVYGTKAYVPQSAWIQTGSIRENVLFGKDMNTAFYEKVLDGCALNQDIQMWVEGDLSVVGERGMNLSGGQKQRIQLARAVYSDSDVYILDDPFSAVDAHTGTHLFKLCLMGLLSEKTVFYATHQLEFLDAADLVLVMKDGKIVQSGKYEDLIVDSDSELVRQMNAHRKSLDQVNPPQEDKSLTKVPCQISQIEVTEERFVRPISCGELSKRGQEEDTETGRVKWSVYSTFVTLVYKGALVPVVLLCQVLFQGLQMASNYWIAWATDEKHNVSREQLIGVFILLSGGSSFFILGRAVLLATIAIKTAQHLFHDMITSVFRAPISFFDSTPSSRILNRSSTDQSTVDTDIPYRLAGLAFALIQLLSIIILMSQVAWQILPLFIVILGISIWYQVYYITTARELARMVGTRKAPILHHFSESITGAVTIRCFNQEDRFLMRSLSFIDDYSRVAFHNCGTMEWLCLRINFLFNFVFFLVLIVLVTLPRSAIDPSLAGLAATYGLNLNVLQAWVIWNMCNVENKMISVERILQFTNIPSEAPLVIENNRPSPEWPSGGKIDLEDLHVQYKPALPTVLKGVTCTFPGEKKIGVVGRTGSGKSTLIQALFRVVEPSGGRILIDGVDISKIGLQDLRSRLSIIPQDPMLFQGSVRTNLDPLEQHSDQEIWEVVHKCRLAEIIRQDQRLLDAPVAEDGENWSVGQRQLTIREETSRCTVITVAHRIPTVIDNDLVLVLDEGKILEYDSPGKLLEDKSSSFSKLVAEFLRRSSKSNQNMDLS